MKKTTLLILLILFSTYLFCQSNKEGIKKLYPQNFNKVIDGKKVGLFFLKNGDLTTAITNYGGRIVSLTAPDKNGNKADVVLGFKSIDEYLNASGVYHGAIIGRVAGRIANGKFDLNGKTYVLPLNGGINHQHGGVKGFHNQVWDVKSVNDTSIVLTYLSINGEMGYPGKLEVEAAYSLTANNDLVLKLNAKTDQSTPVNLTNHAFFNLAGEGNGTILNHVLTIPSKYFCFIDINKIPTGKLAKVNKTPFDFRKPKVIGKDLMLENTNEQLKLAGGYDQTFVLKKKPSSKMVLAATVYEPNSGRKLEIKTDNVSLQFFSANFFKGTDIGKLGKPFNYRASFALETQGFPVAANQKSFPAIILNPNEKYKSITIYHFSMVE
jgi:aldose 1-epimerase